MKIDKYKEGHASLSSELGHLMYIRHMCSALGSCFLDGELPSHAPLSSTLNFVHFCCKMELFLVDAPQFVLWNSHWFQRDQNSLGTNPVQAVANTIFRMVGAWCQRLPIHMRTTGCEHVAWVECSEVWPSHSPLTGTFEQFPKCITVCPSWMGSRLLRVKYTECSTPAC